MSKKNFSSAGALAAEAFLSNPKEEQTSELSDNNKVITSMASPLNNIQTFQKTISKTFNFQKKDLDNVINMTDRFLGLRKKVNQSEIIRMGIDLLMGLNDNELLHELNKLERINLGRKSIKR